MESSRCSILFGRMTTSHYISELKTFVFAAALGGSNVDVKDLLRARQNVGSVAFPKRRPGFYKNPCGKYEAAGAM